MSSDLTTSALDQVTCSSCGAIIPLSEALKRQLVEAARNEVNSELAEKEKKLNAQHVNIVRREAELNNKQKAMEDEYRRKVREEVEKEKGALVARFKSAEKKLQEDAEDKAKQKVATQLSDLQIQLKEKEENLAQSQKSELTLRKKQRELEQRTKDLELEVARQIDQERAKIEEDTARRVMEQHRFKDAEKEKQISDMRKQIEDLKRKAEQGSQQLQGEVQELDLESFLREKFPFDAIQPVPKGVNGADVIQEVNTRDGNLCGRIVWESKRAKAWNNAWIDKLKLDMQTVRGDVAVLVTEVFPKGMDNFQTKDGAWVTTYSSVFGLAVALRETLLQVARVRNAAKGKDEKMEALFSYIHGPQFRQHVTAILEAFKAMQDDLAEEKRVSMRRWAKRETQIERVIGNTSTMYGELQGMVGSSMQSIPALETPESHLEAPASIAGKEISVEDIPF